MKKKNTKKDFEWIEFSNLLEESEEDEFEIGQCYEDIPAKKIKCKKCGSDKFIVGVGSYFTAIKCPNCKWEYCIHEG